MNYSANELSWVFQKTAERLEQEREELNAADEANTNHGDHMVAIFTLAAQAAQAEAEAELAEAMGDASRLLEQQLDNQTAQVYAVGLKQFSQEFAERQVTLDELVQYVQHLLFEQKNGREFRSREGRVLKALVAGLAGWQGAESGSPQPVDMGYLFDLGLYYLQAKQRGGSQAEVLAEAAVSASPLGKVPHRARSGRIAITALLQAIQDLPVNSA